MVMLVVSFHSGSKSYWFNRLQQIFETFHPPRKLAPRHVRQMFMPGVILVSGSVISFPRLLLFYYLQIIQTYNTKLSRKQYNQSHALCFNQLEKWPGLQARAYEGLTKVKDNYPNFINKYVNQRTKQINNFHGQKQIRIPKYNVHPEINSANV